MERGNCKKDLEVFLQNNANRSFTRHEIVEKIAHKRTTIYDNLIRLEKEGKVEKYKSMGGNVGGQFVLWRWKEWKELSNYIRCPHCGRLIRRNEGAI